MTNTHWTLAQTLLRHRQKVTALAKASGLSKNTVYDIVNGKTKAITLDTVDKLLNGLEQLTGESMTVEDVLQREHPSDTDIDPALLAQVADARPFNWEELQKLIPEWTDEERVENERFWHDLEADRRGRGDRRLRALEALWQQLDANDDDAAGPEHPAPRGRAS